MGKPNELRQILIMEMMLNLNEHLDTTVKREFCEIIREKLDELNNGMEN